MISLVVHENCRLLTFLPRELGRSVTPVQRGEPEDKQPPAGQIGSKHDEWVVGESHDRSPKP